MTFFSWTSVLGEAMKTSRQWGLSFCKDTCAFENDINVHLTPRQNSRLSFVQNAISRVVDIQKVVVPA